MSEETADEQPRCPAEPHPKPNPEGGVIILPDVN